MARYCFGEEDGSLLEYVFAESGKEAPHHYKGRLCGDEIICANDVLTCGTIRVTPRRFSFAWYR